MDSPQTKADIGRD